MLKGDGKYFIWGILMRKIGKFIYNIYGNVMVFREEWFDYDKESVLSLIFDTLLIFTLLGTRWYFRYSNIAFWLNDWKKYFVWFGVYFLVNLLIVRILKINNTCLAYFFSVSTPYGLLILVFYAGIERVLVVSGVITMVYCVIQIIFLAAGKRGRRFKNIRKTMRRVVHYTVLCVCVMIFLSAAFVCIKETVSSAIKWNIQKSYYKGVMPVTEHIFSNNKSVLKKFTNESWQRLSIREKEQACLELAQLEALYMVGHVDKELTYYICEDYSPGAGGFYSSDPKRIVADAKYIYDRDYVIKTVCHEMYHYLQHEIIVNGKDVDINDLVTEEALEKYRYEFKNYIDIDCDYESYKEQKVEVDARKYAEKTSEIYINFIENKL